MASAASTRVSRAITNAVTARTAKFALTGKQLRHKAEQIRVISRTSKRREYELRRANQWHAKKDVRRVTTSGALSDKG